MGNRTSRSKPSPSEMELDEYFREIIDEKNQRIYYVNEASYCANSGAATSKICCNNFCMGSEPPKINWKEFFLAHCKGISKVFDWASILPKSISRFKVKSEELYHLEMAWTYHNADEPPVPTKAKSVMDQLSEEAGEMDSSVILHSPRPSFQDDDLDMSFHTQIGLAELEGNLPHYVTSLGINSLAPNHTVGNRPASQSGSVSSNNISFEQIFGNVEYPSKFLSYHNNTFVVPDSRRSVIKTVHPENKEGRIIDVSYFNDIPSDRLIRKYKAVTKLIEGHLSDPRHPLCFLKQQYIKYFLRKYEDLVYEQGENERKMSDLIYEIDLMISDLKEFIRVFKDSLYIFYDFHSLIKGRNDLISVFSRENFLNFVICLIFTEEIYNVVFPLARKLDRERESKLREYLKFARKLRPEDCGVPPKYCLNEVTLRYFKQERVFDDSDRPKKDLMVLYKKRSEIAEERKESECSYSNLQQNRSLENIQVSSTNDEDHKQTKQTTANGEEPETEKIKKQAERHKTPDHSPEEPYSKAIDCLKNIQFLRSPIHKMKILLNCGDLILESIKEFYEENDLPLDKEVIHEEMMLIYTYLISKSAVATIITQGKIIEMILTESQFSSISGYRFITLRACIDRILRKL